MIRVPNEKWTDGRLDERFRAIDDRDEFIVDALKVLRGMPDGIARQITASENRLTAHVRDVDERLDEKIDNVASTCETFRQEYRDDKQTAKEAADKRSLTRTQGFFALTVGACGIVGAITAALITAGAI